MLGWALTFLTIILIVAAVWLSGIAPVIMGVVRELFFLFIIIFIVLLIVGLLTRRGPPPPPPPPPPPV